MRLRLPITAALFFLLSGCGTLKVDIVYDATPSSAQIETRPALTDTRSPAASDTPLPTVSTSPTAAPSATPTLPPTPVDTAVSIAAGYNHTCALFTSGKVKCWGLNDKGQLGDGTLTNRTTPTEVAGLGGVTAIGAGGSHTCALVGGGVKCWGENLSGQLGDGTHTDSPTPVDVAGLTNGVAAIAAGGGHTCALMDRGEIRCWGWNGDGQLGDGTNIDRSNPVPVDAAGALFYAVTAGYQHTCGLTTSAGVKCWGKNEAGQLGDGTHAGHPQPADVEGLRTTVLSLSLGEFHSCAVMYTHTLQCWGDNQFGQLADDTVRNSLLPIPVAGLADGVTAVSAGSGHTCALTKAGTECWGRNYFGQLGNGTKDNSSRPVAVVGFSLTAAAIAAGGNHTCGLTAGGGVRCWGNNAFGQLGDGTTVDRSTPVDAVRLGFAALEGKSVRPMA
jgi:alpha-tubulin suppressor-like RCC1 family protein